jgi:hypothetical protein
MMSAGFAIFVLVEAVGCEKFAELAFFKMKEILDYIPTAVIRWELKSPNMAKF